MDTTEQASDESFYAATVATALYEAHSRVASVTGDTYTSLTASWTGDDGKLHTITFSTTEPDDDEDDGAPI